MNAWNETIDRLTGLGFDIVRGPDNENDWLAKRIYDERDRYASTHVVVRPDQPGHLRVSVRDVGNAVIPEPLAMVLIQRMT